MVKFKIVRKWEDKKYMYGLDNKGQVFIKCKDCDTNMNLFDMEFKNGRKILKYFCSSCKKIKEV